MRTLLFLILLCLVATTVPAAQGQTLIRVGVYQDKPLVFIDEAGRVEGLYPDILEHIAGQEGWSIEYVPGSWSQCLVRLEAGIIDLLTAIGFSEAREERFVFNQEAVVTNWAQVYVRQGSDIETMIDLSGTTMAVVSNDIYFQTFKQVEDMIEVHPQYLEVPEYLQVLEMVDQGRAESGLVPRILGKAHEHEYGIEPTAINFSPVELRFAAPKGGDPELLATIDSHLSAMKADSNSVYYQSRTYWLEGIRTLVLPRWLRPEWVVAGSLAVLALLIAGVLLLRRQVRSRSSALRQSTEAREKLEGELQAAHAIQMEMLPRTMPPFPERSEFELHAFIEPAHQVGGDLYDFFLLEPTRLCVVIGDVSGKGVPASLLMSRTKTLVHITARHLGQTDAICREVNKELCRNNDSYMFVTLFCAILETDTGLVHYTSAGHNPPVVVGPSCGPSVPVTGNDIVLGIDPDADFNRHTVHLTPGQIMVLYTDGITEAFNKKREQYSEERLMRTLSGCSTSSPRLCIRDLIQDVRLFSQGLPQRDDITVVALQYTGG